MNETEELLSILSELGITDEQLGMLKDQMKTADELRRYQPQTTIQTSGGVVPAYGSMLLGMVERGRAKKEKAEAQKGITEALERQRSGRERFGRALMAPPPAPMGPPPAGPMGPPAPSGPMGPPAPMGGPGTMQAGGPGGMPAMGQGASPAAPPAPMPAPPQLPPKRRPMPQMDPNTAAVIKRLQSYGTTTPMEPFP
jgi:hypothetical protein